MNKKQENETKKFFNSRFLQAAIIIVGLALVWIMANFLITKLIGAIGFFAIIFVVIIALVLVMSTLD